MRRTIPDIQLKSKGVQSSKDQGEIGRGLSAFEIDDPLATDSHVLGELRLRKESLLSDVADQMCELSRASNDHYVLALRLVRVIVR